VRYEDALEDLGNSFVQEVHMTQDLLQQGADPLPGPAGQLNLEKREDALLESRRQ
jgi:hypothetical protein